MLETIQQSAISHDRYQVELKLDYELGKGKKTHYRISTYLFFPNSLGITVESFPKNEFYREVKNYIRIKTPILSLRDLIDSEITPLSDAREIVHRPSWYQDDEANERLIQTLKLFGAMFKSTLREHLNLIEKRIQNASSEAKIHTQVENLIEEFITQSKQISSQYRTFIAELNQPLVKEDTFLAYTLVDEYISLLVEESATEMFKNVSKHYDKSNQSKCLDDLQKIAETERDHRISHGYGSILKPGEANEVYTFRSSVLKKYVSSILHLATDAQREGKGMEQVLMAIAAGVSMIFATIIAFYFQQIYGNFTFPVFVALVIGYMFKDRIKEMGRALLANKLQTILYDRRINIKTLDGKYRLAVLREKMSFIRENNLPQSVRTARHKDPFADLDNEGMGETIICHTKDIVLDGKLFPKAFKGFPKVSGLNDIIRYNIQPYLRKMADPVEDQPLLENGQLKNVRTHKVYHINIVSRYKSISPQVEILYKRMRLVLTRKGIKRIEYISL
jgi:predicted Zn-ribbon and HTH transcriptional regulator